MEKQQGSVVVTESGVGVLLTGLDLVGEVNGHTRTYDEGILFGPENTARKLIFPPAGAPHRQLCARSSPPLGAFRG